jgi:hypothetical protein
MTDRAWCALSVAAGGGELPALVDTAGRYVRDEARSRVAQLKALQILWNLDDATGDRLSLVARQHRQKPPGDMRLWHGGGFHHLYATITGGPGGVDDARGRVDLAKYWASTRMGWKSTTVHQHQGITDDGSSLRLLDRRRDRKARLRCVASTRAWPAIRPPSSPTSAGLVQPHSLMLAAMAATWASVWVRAFLAYGIRRSIGHRSTLSAGHGL